MFAPAKLGWTLPVPTAKTTLALAEILTTSPSIGLTGILIVAVGLLVKISKILLVDMVLNE